MRNITIVILKCVVFKPLNLQNGIKVYKSQLLLVVVNKITSSSSSS